MHEQTFWRATFRTYMSLTARKSEEKLRHRDIPLAGFVLSQRENMVAVFVNQQDQLVRYARAASGDTARAEDLVQEAWLRCERVADTQAIDQPSHLLWRVLRNLCIDRKRQISREQQHFVAADDDKRLLEHPHEQRSVEDMLIARDELRRVQDTLNAMDWRARTAFEMHRLEGAKLREIAEHLGISITVAHGLVARAMMQIRAAVRG